MTSEAYITRQYYSEKVPNSEALFLSVLVSQTSFMYAISTNGFKNVRELCHIEIKHLVNTAFNLTDNVSFLISNYQLQNKKFEKINVSFLNTDFTMVPQAFAVSADMKPILNFVTGTEQVNRSLQHTLKNLNFCYTIELDLLTYFEKTFPNASIRHQGSVNIDLFFSQHTLKNANLYLNIGDGCIEIVAKQKTDLLFYNVFNYETNEDILYYLLFTMEQFQLNPLHVRLSIAAQQSVSDDLILSIKKYIQQVDFCVNDSTINLSGDLSKLPQHYYFTLLNQHLCEL